jgi:hypothetical protein
MRYELSDYEWTAIKPMLPNKPRGVRRVNDRQCGVSPYSIAAIVSPKTLASALRFEGRKRKLPTRGDPMTKRSERQGKSA